MSRSENETRGQARQFLARKKAMQLQKTLFPTGQARKHIEATEGQDAGTYSVSKVDSGGFSYYFEADNGSMTAMVHVEDLSIIVLLAGEDGWEVSQVH